MVAQSYPHGPKLVQLTVFQVSWRSADPFGNCSRKTRGVHQPPRLPVPARVKIDFNNVHVHKCVYVHMKSVFIIEIKLVSPGVSLIFLLPDVWRCFTEESAPLQLTRLPSGGERLPFGGERLRQLLAGVRERRSRLPLCKRVKQELPPLCADDVECQRHYLQHVDNIVRMLEAGRRRRRWTAPHAESGWDHSLCLSLMRWYWPAQEARPVWGLLLLWLGTR